jgi:hypothetical protein
MTWEQRTLLLDVAMPEPRWSAFFATLIRARIYYTNQDCLPAQRPGAPA